MKKVTILGSAAAEGIPAMFCNCRVCVEAWKNGEWKLYVDDNGSIFNRRADD